MARVERKVTRIETVCVCDLCGGDAPMECQCHGCQRIVCAKCQVCVKLRPLCKTCAPIWRRFDKRFREWNKGYEALVGERRRAIDAAIKQEPRDD